MTDWGAVAIAALAVIPTTIASVAALIVSLKNHKKIDELHVVVNSRLSELLATTAHASKAEGQAEGIEAERSRSPRQRRSTDLH